MKIWLPIEDLVFYRLCIHLNNKFEIWMNEYILKD